jgi:hypothetical protein
VWRAFARHTASHRFGVCLFRTYLFRPVQGLPGMLWPGMLELLPDMSFDDI